jgi:hypothetical protein
MARIEPERFQGGLMKALLIGSLIALSLGAWADKHKDKKWDKLPFEQQKQMRLEKLDQKSAIITEARNCVNAATTKESLKQCKTDMKDDKRAMKESFKDRKKQAEEAREED